MTSSFSQFEAAIDALLHLLLLPGTSQPAKLRTINIRLYRFRKLCYLMGAQGVLQQTTVNAVASVGLANIVSSPSSTLLVSQSASLHAAQALLLRLMKDSF